MIYLGTLFSGIGSIEHALEKMGIMHKLIFACDNGERYLDIDEDAIRKQLEELETHEERKKFIDNLYNQTGKINYVQRTYEANFKLDRSDYYQDVRFFEATKYKNMVDLIVGGSPCQSFSISGNQLGLEDTRGTLFYDFARIVSEIKPKVFIYENVPGILSNDKGKTWKAITSVFNEIGYSWSFDILNSKDFGIPQNRNRVFVVGFRKDLDISSFVFPKHKELKCEVKDFLENDVPKKYYLGEKGFKWVTNEKNLKKRVSINSKIMRTQAANQQFNWCGEMRFVKCSDTSSVVNDDESRIYLSSFNGEMGSCRKLTPRECLRLMGFSDTFNIVVDDQKMYRQAGNSIVVNVLESIMDKILETGVFSND